MKKWMVLAGFLAAIIMAWSCWVYMPAKEVAIQYVTKPVLLRLARQVVESYTPAGRYSWAKESKVANFHSLNFYAREAAYGVAAEEKRISASDIYKNGFNEAILKAVNLALSDPKKLFAFYYQNVDFFLWEMRVQAQRKLSPDEVREMFFLYKTEAENFSEYIAWALKSGPTIEPLFAKVKLAEFLNKRDWQKYARAEPDSEDRKSAKKLLKISGRMIAEAELDVLRASGCYGRALNTSDWKKAYPVLWFERRRDQEEEVLRTCKFISDDLVSRLGQIIKDLG